MKKELNLGLFLVASFLHNFGIGIIPPLLADIQRDLHLSLLEISLVTAAFGIGRLFADLPAGIWTDRIGYFSVFTGGIVLGLLGTAASGFASSVAVLLGGRLFVGLGHALKAVGGLSILMDKYGPSRWGRVTNLLEFTGVLALMLSALVAGKLTVLFGWRTAFFLPWRWAPSPCSWSSLASVGRETGRPAPGGRFHPRLWRHRIGTWGPGRPGDGSSLRPRSLVGLSSCLSDMPGFSRRCSRFGRGFGWGSMRARSAF